jgi:type I restriction-modification system DNA methylase subunit
LKKAVESGFTGYHPSQKVPYVFGIDIDGEVVKRWEEISILDDLFKGKEAKMLHHFHEQDGLLELPKKVFPYKPGGLAEFDAVVGNPPYGGMGFSSLKDKNAFETKKILEHLSKFEILTFRKRANGKKNEDQMSLLGSFQLGDMLLGGGGLLPQPKEVESLPIEILFIDRFIQLAKPGGFIAIIIPDGILANSTFHYVREFIIHKTKVEAIISLPRETFKAVGTNAKTSILILRKKDKTEANIEYPIFLASTEKLSDANFDKIAEKFKEVPL